MPTNYFALPAAQMPQNALIDFSGLNNGIEAFREQSNHLAQVGRQQEQQQYQRGRDAKSDARSAQNDARTQVEWFGKQALAVDQIQGPQRAAAWQRIIARHPDRANLTPEYLDPVQGPKMVAAEAGQWQDPLERQTKEAELAYKQAQTQKVLQEASGQGSPADAPMNVREWEYFSKLPPDKQSQYLNMKRSIPYLNQETQFTKPDPITGQPMATIPINNVDAAAQKELGQSIGKNASSAPSDLASADEALDLLNSILTDPNRAQGTAVYSPIVNQIPKTPGYAFQNKVNQAKSGAFLTAIQQLRGMGALSNAEGDTATKAVTSMNTATDDASFEESARRYEAIILRGRRQAERMLAERGRLTTPQAQPQAPAPQQGQAPAPATGGPQPGEVMDGYRFKGGNPGDPNSWEKVQ